jgi:hypothetical protein
MANVRPVQSLGNTHMPHFYMHLERAAMIRRLLMVPLTALTLTLTTTGSGAFAADELPPLPMPAVAMPAPTHLTLPPGENTYFPLGEHGQAYYLNMDGTVNWTDIINKTYVSPYWRGEDWSPYPTYWLTEHQSRLMAGEVVRLRTLIGSEAHRPYSDRREQP